MKIAIIVILALLCLTCSFLSGFFCGAAKEYAATQSIHNYMRLWEYIRMAPALEGAESQKLKNEVAERIESALDDAQIPEYPYSFKLLKSHLFNQQWMDTWKHNSLASANDAFSPITDLPLSVKSREILGKYKHEFP